MNEFENIRGKWRSSSPWDSDDYMSEYEVSGSSIAPIVKARDLYDGEEFIISNTKWEDNILSFHSSMPSTGREGINKFYINQSGELICEFTFTVKEVLSKSAT